MNQIPTHHLQTGKTHSYFDTFLRFTPEKAEFLLAMANLMEYPSDDFSREFWEKVIGDSDKATVEFCATCWQWLPKKGEKQKNHHKTKACYKPPKASILVEHDYFRYLAESNLVRTIDTCDSQGKMERTNLVPMLFSPSDRAPIKQLMKFDQPEIRPEQIEPAQLYERQEATDDMRTQLLVMEVESINQDYAEKHIKAQRIVQLEKWARDDEIYKSSQRDKATAKASYDKEIKDLDVELADAYLEVKQKHNKIDTAIEADGQQKQANNHQEYLKEAGKAYLEYQGVEYGDYIEGLAKLNEVHKVNLTEFIMKTAAKAQEEALESEEDDFDDLEVTDEGEISDSPRELNVSPSKGSKGRGKH